SLDGFHSNRALASSAFGGCSFLRNGRAERHSAVQRIPRSHSSASLRSRSAVALSSVARASLRYRIARALLMASQIPTQQNEDSSRKKDLAPGRSLGPLRRLKGSRGSDPRLLGLRVRPETSGRIAEFSDHEAD